MLDEIKNALGSLNSSDENVGLRGAIQALGQGVETTSFSPNKEYFSSDRAGLTVVSRDGVVAAVMFHFEEKLGRLPYAGPLPEGASSESDLREVLGQRGKPWKGGGVHERWLQYDLGDDRYLEFVFAREGHLRRLVWGVKSSLPADAR